MNIYRIRKLLKKIRIKIDRRNRNSHVTNKKEIKVTMKIVRKKDILKNQEKDIIIKVNTTFRFKSLINHKNEYIELHDYSRTVIKKISY